jgi:hypothetical protein
MYGGLNVIVPWLSCCFKRLHKHRISAQSDMMTSCVEENFLMAAVVKCGINVCSNKHIHT